MSVAGVKLKQLLVAKPQSAADAWWTAEQALRSGACSAVLAWLSMPDERRMRRLQLGAESGRAWGVLFRSASAAQQRSTAALRLRLEATANGLGGAYPQTPWRACEQTRDGESAANQWCSPRTSSGAVSVCCAVADGESCSEADHAHNHPLLSVIFMLWLALHFPALSLEIFSRGGAAPEPLAVIEKQGNRSRVKTCNEAASACGVRPGMPASAAQALVANLIVRSRDIEAEQESLAGLAAWAGQFTPAVSLQPPDGLLIEIGSCLRLHRGFNNLIRKISSGLNEMGYTFTHACAPTPHAAWLMALAGKEVAIRESAQLEKVLGALPVRLLDQSQDTLASLEMVGAHTLGDCLRFPRAGMARRFGQSLLDELDRALGRLPEAREFFVPPPSFERRLELPSQVHEAEALLFASRRLLLELEGYLSLRQAGVQEFELVCCHEDVPDTVLKVGFAEPARALERMLLLLRETLAAPACLPRFTPSCSMPAAFRPWSYPTWTCSRIVQTTGDGNLLLERLRIRLGKEAVFGIAPAADHRPELAWRHCETGEEASSPSKLQRPLWLLPKPMPCQKDRLDLKSGPERIESGWWDGMDVVRDYYVAQGRNGSRLWVFRDRSSGAWFVHGLFRLKHWMICMNDYAELHCLSNFTFLRGASHPEELVTRAHELGYAALAITDECSLAGIVRAHVAAKACGLKLIVGSEIRFADGPGIVLLATDRTGYGNLSELITKGRRSDIKGRYSLALSDIQNGLPGCLALLLPDPLPSLEQAQQVAAAFPGGHGWRWNCSAPLTTRTASAH